MLETWKPILSAALWHVGFIPFLIKALVSALILLIMLWKKESCDKDCVYEGYTAEAVDQSFEFVRRKQDIIVLVN
jgi:hypothetical protein